MPPDKPKRKRNTNPRPYRQGLDFTITVRVSKEEFIKFDTLRKRLKITRRTAIQRAINLMESEI